MCYYLLDGGGVPWTAMFLFFGLFSLILGLSFVTTTCQEILPSVGFPLQVWLIIHGSLSCLFAAIFLLHRRLSQNVNDCQCLRSTLGVFASLFTLAWFVVVIVMLSEKTKPLHENNCDALHLITILLLIPSMVFELLFYLHIICVPLPRGSEYIKIFITNDREPANPY